MLDGTKLLIFVKNLLNCIFLNVFVNNLSKFFIIIFRFIKLIQMDNFYFYSFIDTVLQDFQNKQLLFQRKNKGKTNYQIAFYAENMNYIVVLNFYNQKYVEIQYFFKKHAIK